MKLINYMSMAWVALALTACSSDEIGLASPDLFPEVNIKATVKQPGKTRSNPIGTAEQMAKFNTGDQLRLTCEGQEDVIYQLGENGKWMPQNGKLMRWKAQEQTFSAYYPANNALPQWTIVHTDQSVDTENENPSHKIEQADYMSCTVTQQMGNTLNLPMERKTARVIIKVSFNEEYSTEQPNISQMFIHANANLEALNIHGFSQFQPFRNGLEFTALVAPTAAQPDDLFIIIYTDKGTIHVDGIPEFVAGKSYTFNLRIGGGTVTLGEATVEDWTDGVTHDGLVPQGLAPIVDPLTHTIKVLTAGTLTNELVGEALNGGNELKVEGWLNGTDLKAIERYCKTNYSDLQNPIKVLDMQKAKIRAGGDESLVVPKNDVIPENLFSSSSLRKVIIPEGITEIQGTAFCQSDSLREIVLSPVLTTIGADAFSYTPRLKNINLPESLETIGNYAFNESGLETLVIPAKVQTIGIGFIRLCFSLTTLTFKGTPNKYDQAFSDFNTSENCNLTIPQAWANRVIMYGNTPVFERLKWKSIKTDTGFDFGGIKDEEVLAF